MFKSGGAKKGKCDLRREKLESILGFCGGGGHVESCGIRNFCPLGVEHVAASEKSMSLFFDGSCFVLLLVLFLFLEVVVIAEGTIS
ncbi:hypothetical protein DEO72_LG7g3183 [Vigna unguiculata]|uniref:Uncharacterized protein n=1 Tax=Vigna unguiculata TaxID=3917 RepID=A0A4D6MKG1_VIGUN|nr:hypothetical protein DEO72_LG7g3183 [Vigna unguiculata]